MRRIGPTGGDRLVYNWVSQARFAADGAGDFAAVWSQQDPTTHVWTTLLRYQRAGGRLGPPRVLGHTTCDPSMLWCADVAMSAAGDATVAWTRRGSTAQRVLTARRTRAHALSEPQTLYTETVSYVFRGVAVAANAAGDATVSFIGGDANVFYREFARCAAGRRCSPLVRRREDPSWLDSLALAIAPSGATTMSWVTGCVGEACRADHVWARRLVSVG
jgi:hypothetical protein